MAINKQAFYEGAALHLVACTSEVTSIRHQPPFFLLNNHVVVLLKYSTKIRSPWSFSFTQDEQAILTQRASGSNIILGLICGADGVAALDYEDYLTVASPRKSAIHIACYRLRGEYYEINGPDGRLHSKVPPSLWPKILQPRGIKQ